MRVTREKVTVSFTYLIRSDEADPGYPQSKDGSKHETKYIGRYPLGTEDLSRVRDGMLKRIEALFPVSGGVELEFESAETTKVE